jgi:hypothetical protein
VISGLPRQRHVSVIFTKLCYLCIVRKKDMEISLKKWFSNPDGKTRYKVILPAENFVSLPTKFVAIGMEFQVMKSEGQGYRLTLFGERRMGWLESVGVTPTGLSWKDEILNSTNSHQASTPWMKKKDVMAVIEKIMPLEINSWRTNDLIKPHFRNLELK